MLYPTDVNKIQRTTSAIHDASDLTLFVRGASLASVFGRAWTGQPDTDAAIEPVVSAIKSIVAVWCGGRTLVDMEAFAL